MFKTFEKIRTLLENNDVTGFAEFAESLSNEYDILKSQEWASPFIEVDKIKNEDLPFPRLEARWRDDINLKDTKVSEGSSVIDFFIVYKFGKSISYSRVNSCQTSDVDQKFRLEATGRMHWELLNLSYQLKIPAYITFRENVFKLEFPKRKDELSFGILDIMSKEDLDKLL